MKRELRAEYIGIPNFQTKKLASLPRLFRTFGALFAFRPHESWDKAKKKKNSNNGRGGKNAPNVLKSLRRRLLRRLCHGKQEGDTFTFPLFRLIFAMHWRYAKKASEYACPLFV